MPTRLVATSSRYRHYEDTDDTGTVIGTHDVAVLSAEEQAQVDVEARARAALAANTAFLAGGPPTPAQLAAQVRLLTRECNALIRLVLAQYDSADGT